MKDFGYIFLARFLGSLGRSTGDRFLPFRDRSSVEDISRNSRQNDTRLLMNDQKEKTDKQVQLKPSDLYRLKHNTELGPPVLVQHSSLPKPFRDVTSGLTQRIFRIGRIL